MRAKLALLVLPAAVFFAAPYLYAASATNSVSTKNERNILNEFQQWAETYAAAGPSDKSTLAANGLSRAKQRRSVLAALIESDSQEALRQAVPTRLRAQLPAEIVAQLEEPVSGRGDYSVIATLRTPGADKTVRPIDRFATIAGRTYQAFVYGRMLTQPMRKNIPLSGVAIDGKLALEENQEATKRENTKNPGSPWTFGIKSVLYMRVNFPDDLSESISTNAAVSMMNDASNWYSLVSYQKTGLKATVTPLLTLPRTKSDYSSSGDYVGLLNDARAVAKTNGFDTANFDLDCVNFQPIFAGWGGRAYVGSKSAWFQSFDDLATCCHEFGHNYGLWHANAWDTSSSWTTDTGTIIGPGFNTEYGNVYDTMGGSREEGQPIGGGQYHFNACEKNLLGWLPDANVATVTTSGVYRVYAFDVPALNSNSFHALRIQKDDVRYYWAELRTMFANLRWVQGGLILNWSPWQNSNGGTDLLDANPGTSFGRNDDPLVVGETFTDPFANIHLTILRKNTNTIPVSVDAMVQLGSFPGNRPPTVTLNASATSVNQNVPVIFTATASDPDGDALAYYWDFADDNIDAVVAPNAPIVTNSWRFTEHYLARCTVSDMKGGTASAQVLITIGSAYGAYTISGRIQNGSAPVEGVRVNCSGVGEVGFTDSNGNYILGNVFSATRTLTATKPGLTLNPANFSNPVSVGASMSNLNFSATPIRYNISGDVQELGGYIVSGVNVTLSGVSANSTDADQYGSYIFTNVPVGSYYLSATKPGYELRPQFWSNPVAVEWQDAIGKRFDARLLFSLTKPRWTNGAFTFRFSGGSNRVFRIDTSTNLATWTPLATVTNTTGQLDFPAPSPANSRGFYRAAHVR